MILNRGPKLCNFVEWRGYKVVYKRYASLYFCMCIDEEDNELEVLEIIHHYVEILDRYFGSVSKKKQHLEPLLPLLLSLTLTEHLDFDREWFYL